MTSRSIRSWAGVATIFGLANFSAACSLIAGFESISDEPPDGGGCPAEVVTECPVCLECKDVAYVQFVGDDWGRSKPLPKGKTAGVSHFDPAACPRGASGPEHIYAVTLPGKQDTGFVTAQLTRDRNTTFDSVLYVLDDCCSGYDAEVCADSHDNTNGLHGGEMVSFYMWGGQTKYIVVDGANGEQGDYQLILGLFYGGNCIQPVQVTIEDGTPMKFVGTTGFPGGMNLNTGQCDDGLVGAAAEAIYGVSVGAGVSNLEFEVHGNFDTSLYVRSGCDDDTIMHTDQIECANSSGTDEVLSVPITEPPRTVYLFVDSGASLPTGTGEYELTVTPSHTP